MDFIAGINVTNRNSFLRCFLNGGISLTARTVDCDSTNAGSTPVYHPIKKWRGSLKKKILSKTFSGNSSKLFSFIEG